MRDSYDHARSIAIAERRWLVDARARLQSSRTTRTVRVTRLATRLTARPTTRPATPSAPNPSKDQ